MPNRRVILTYNEHLSAVFKVLTAVLMMIQIFWDVTLYCWVTGNRRFGDRVMFTFKTQAIEGEFLNLEDEGTNIVPHTSHIQRLLLSTLVGLKAVTGSNTSDV